MLGGSKAAAAAADDDADLGDGEGEDEKIEEIPFFAGFGSAGVAYSLVAGE